MRICNRALKCETEDEARALLDAWCKENEVPVPFLQVFNVHRGTRPDAQAIRTLATATLSQKYFLKKNEIVTGAHSQTPRLSASWRRQKFSNVGALVHLIDKVTIKRTSEK